MHIYQSLRLTEFSIANYCFLWSGTCGTGKISVSGLIFALFSQYEDFKIAQKQAPIWLNAHLSPFCLLRIIAKGGDLV